jgi:hypothetical protein
MFEFYDRVAQVKLAGTWLFLFDSLYGSKGISPEQESSIIVNLEKMFVKVTETKPSDAGVYETLNPWAAEAAAQRLAQHYRSKGDKSNVERVVSPVRKTNRNQSEDHTEGRRQSHLAEWLHVYLSGPIRLIGSQASR